MKTLAAFGLVGLLAVSTPAQAFDYITQPDGLNYARLDASSPFGIVYNVVFIGDGFTSSEMGDFDDAVSHCLYTSADFGDGLLDIEPYKSAVCGIRFWKVQLISNESGIDDPTAGIFRNTPLDCSFGDVGEPSMKISGDPGKCAAAVNEAGVPSWDFIVVITNTPTRSGAYFPSAGSVVYLSSRIAWGIYLAHELGHAIASLGDEYECEICDPDAPDYGRTIPVGTILDEPNLSTNLDDIKWKSEIPDWVVGRFIPTVPEHICDCEVVGAWEGGGTYSYGVYRSQEYCAMDQVTCSSGDAFCVACTNALKEALSGCAHPIAFLGMPPTRFWVLPICFVCDAESAVADDLRRQMEFDAMVMKFLHRGPFDWLGGPGPLISVYDDWGERIPVRTVVHGDVLEISFNANRIRRYTVVAESRNSSPLPAFDAELYRNGVREPGFDR